jgi:hypothetical protein
MHWQYLEAVHRLSSQSQELYVEYQPFPQHHRGTDLSQNPTSSPIALSVPALKQRGSDIWPDIVSLIYKAILRRIETEIVWPERRHKRAPCKGFPCGLRLDTFLSGQGMKLSIHFYSFRSSRNNNSLELNPLEPYCS